jgi:hypothetical protein
LSAAKLGVTPTGSSSLATIAAARMREDASPAM